MNPEKNIFRIGRHLSKTPETNRQICKMTLNTKVVNFVLFVTTKACLSYLRLDHLELVKRYICESQPLYCVVAIQPLFTLPFHKGIENPQLVFVCHYLGVQHSRRFSYVVQPNILIMFEIDTQKSFYTYTFAYYDALCHRTALDREPSQIGYAAVVTKGVVTWR